MRLFGRGVRVQSGGTANAATGVGAPAFAHGHCEFSYLQSTRDTSCRQVGNYVESVLDEIALEGLDGITAEALKIRLQDRHKNGIDGGTGPGGGKDLFRSEVDSVDMDFIFQIVLARCRRNGDLRFFRLSQKRPDLIVYDRYQNVDPDLGMVLEPNEKTLPVDPYPYFLVDDTPVGKSKSSSATKQELLPQPEIKSSLSPFGAGWGGQVKGSCLEFFTRVDVTSEILDLAASETDKIIGFQDAAKIFCGGHLSRLVVVADAKLRMKSLLGFNCDPSLYTELTAIRWAILERIGRARRIGEATNSKRSLIDFTQMSPKSLFYHRKCLPYLGLVQLQDMAIKSSSGQNVKGYSLQLPRFFVERRSKSLTYVYNICCYLKTYGGSKGAAVSSDIGQATGIPGTSMKKLFKNADFKRYLLSDVRLPYRYFFPNAELKEWKCKNRSSSGAEREKQFRCLQLIDVNMVPESILNDSKDDELQEQNDDDEEGGIGSSGGSSSGANGGVVAVIMRAEAQRKNRAKFLLLDQSVARLAFKMVEESGSRGISQRETARLMGITHLESRGILKHMVRKDLVVQYTVDKGKQRVFMYVSKSNFAGSDEAQQMRLEKLRKEELVQQATTMQSQPKSLVSDDSLVTTGPDDHPGLEGDKNSSEAAAGVSNLVQISFSTNAEESLPTPKRNSSMIRGQRQNKVPPLQPQRQTTEEVGEPEKQRLANQLGHQSRSEVGTPSGNYLKRVKRENTVLQEIRDKEVIDDCVKLLHLIRNQEKQQSKQGGGAMDKRSLNTILVKLAREKLIKTIIVKIALGEKVKTLVFVCIPSVTKDHSVIKSAVDRAKIKFHLKSKEILKKELLKSEGSNTLVKVNPLKSPGPFFNPEGVRNIPGKTTPLLDGTSKEKRLSASEKLQIGIAGGLPKFARMRELHHLFIYMCRDYSGTILTNAQKDALIEDQKQRGVDIPRQLEEEIKAFDFYSSETDWKMFISPLPKHQGWDDGWCLFSDILLRVPLSIAVKIINVKMPVRNLDVFLEHPIRRHYPVQYLPVPMMNSLLMGTRFTSLVYEVVSKLALIGLLQVGPHNKFKELTFIYVNQRASLWNTMTSDSGYHHIEQKEYEVAHYKFQSLHDADMYWHDLERIALYTTLGRVVDSEQNKEVSIEKMDRKVELIEVAMRPRTSEEAVQLDNGEIPGDHLGAAGLDSSSFVHLKRNWSFATRSRCTESGADKGALNLHLSHKMSRTRVTIEPNVKRSQRGQKRKRKDTLADKGHSDEDEGSCDRDSKAARSDDGTRGSKLNSLPFPAGALKRPSEGAVTRVIKRRVLKKRKRQPYYNEEDKQALAKMKKMRVHWSSREDSYLLLCKVAGAFFSKNHKGMASYVFVRNFLQNHLPESLDKTSRACQRRVSYMLKNPTSLENVGLYLADADRDQKIQEAFPRGRIEKYQEEKDEAKKEAEFVVLVEMLLKKCKVDLADVPTFDLPSTTAELESNFRVVRLPTLAENFSSQAEPDSLSDVSMSVIRSVILSSLHSASLKTYQSYQLYKIYQQYPELLLRNVMDSLRSERMVSIKKTYNSAKVKQKRHLPLYNSPYQLSSSYFFKFYGRFSQEVFEEGWDLTKKLIFSAASYKDATDGLELKVQSERGFAATLVGLMAESKVSFLTKIPDEVIYVNYVNDTTRPYRDSKTNITVAKEDPTSKEPVPFKALQGLFQAEEPLTEDQSSKALKRRATRTTIKEIRGATAGQKVNCLSLNPCRIFASLSSKTVSATEDLVEVGVKSRTEWFAAPRSLLPVNPDKIEQVMNWFGLRGNGSFSLSAGKLKRTVLPKELPSLEDVVAILGRAGDSGFDEKDLRDTFLFIKSKGPMGCTNAEMRAFRDGRRSGTDDEAFERLLKFMMSELLVVRTGVASIRFVSALMAEPWLLKSFRMTRQVREANTDANAEDHPSFSTTTSSADAGTEETETPDVILVVVRPWLKVDGNLNKRVMDKMLSSVLGYLVQNPGVSLARTMDKYKPALPPQQCWELVDILIDIGCVDSVTMDSDRPMCRLFQTDTGPRDLKMRSPSSMLDDPALVLLEPKINAIAILGQFIGEKQYANFEGVV